LECPGKKIINLSLVGKTDLPLGGMDVDVNQGWVYFKEKCPHGVPAREKPSLVGVVKGVDEPPMDHRPAIHVDTLKFGRRLMGVNI
jgi:hypothetical protein